MFCSIRRAASAPHERAESCGPRGARTTRAPSMSRRVGRTYEGLVTASAEAASVAVVAVVVGILIVILALDILVFRGAVRLSSHLDANRMLVTEKVFGFLLAALAVQLTLSGLADVGVIHLTGH